MKTFIYIAAILLGFIGFFIGLFFYSPVSLIEPILLSAIISAVLLIAVILGRKGVESRPGIIFVLYLAIGGMLFTSTLGWVLGLNGVLDTSQPQLRTSKVISKERRLSGASGGKFGVSTARGNFVALPHPLGLPQFWEVDAPPKLFERIKPNSSQFEYTLKKGAFGFAWVEESRWIDLQPSN